MTAFGTSASFGTLNSWPQDRHLTRLSAALAAKIQLLPQFGHWAIIRIGRPFTTKRLSMAQATRRLKGRPKYFSHRAKKYLPKCACSPIISRCCRRYRSKQNNHRVCEKHGGGVLLDSVLQICYYNDNSRGINRMIEPTPCTLVNSVRLAETHARLSTGRRSHCPREKEGVVAVDVRVRYGHNSMPNGVRWHVPTPGSTDDLTGQIVDYYA